MQSGSPKDEFGLLSNPNQYSSYHFLSFWQFKHVSFFIKDAKDTILYEPRLLSKVFMIHFPHVIEPCYNKEKKVFAFKVRYHHYYKISIFHNYRIQYLIPLSATEHEMVFSGLGKKLDSEGNPTEEDETYTISFEDISHPDKLKE